MFPASPAAESTPRIVKADATGLLGTPIAFNYQDLRQACDQHLVEVQEWSRKLIGDATGEADRLKREAAEAGRRDGYREGLKTAEAEVNSRVERLISERLAAQLATLTPAIRQVADEMRLERDRWAARWEGEGIRLAVAIAEKLIRRSITDDATTADQMIGDTLRLAAGSPHVTIKLSPVDHDRLGGSVKGLTEAAGAFGSAEVLADAAVTPGGCLIEMRHGRIDGRLETQLERIAAELTGSDRRATP